MKIRSMAASLPARRVTNDDVADLVRHASSPHLPSERLDEIVDRLDGMMFFAGCKHRRIRGAGERAGDFALRAAKEALDKAGLGPKDIDLVIYAGVGRGWLEPGMSHYFSHALGLSNATCFDILDACLSWLRAVHVAYHFLKNRAHRHVLVLNAEFTVAEYADWKFTSLREVDYRFGQCTMGEAATATVLAPGEDGPEPYFEFKTDASLHNLCKIPLPHIGQFSDDERCPSLAPLVFFAYSNELFKAGQRLVADLYRGSPELLRRPYDIAFAHSASKAIINRVDQELGANGRTVNLFAEFGNTVSASVPLAMCWAADQGRLQRGMPMMLVVASAGLSAGIAHMTY